MSASRDDENWRIAKDPKTGREYYYNKVTKETTWTKPLALASDEEKAERERVRLETRKFFDEMERNILRKADPSYIEPDIEEREDSFDFEQALDQMWESEPTGGNMLKRRGSIGGIRLVRTISSLDDDILNMMKKADEKKSPNNYGRRSFSPSFKSDNKPSRVMDQVALAVAGEAEPKDGRPKSIKRRNSTGTIYVDSTMSKQDNKATIKCVCAVIRAHMVEAESERIAPRPQFDTFKDADFVNERPNESKAEWEERRKVPSLEKVVKFFDNAFSKSQMESECIIMTLIYVERLVKVTKGRFCIRFDNWRPTVFSCMILSSKVWDDLSMWNVDFSQISPSFDLQRINELELAVLDALNYEVKVPAGEYAKYYFHLRSMIARLGFHDKSNTGSKLCPLNLQGARKLQLATESYEEAKLSSGSRPRCASIHVETPARITLLSRMHSTGAVDNLQHRVTIGLDQLMHGTHIHGDGGMTTGPHNRRPSAHEAMAAGKK